MGDAPPAVTPGPARAPPPMNPAPGRRAFLRRSGLAAAAAAAGTLPQPGCATRPVPAPAATTTGSLPPFPPHLPLAVPGVHAYPLEHSVAAGDRLELCVSASVPYELTVCRLGRRIDDPAGDEVLHRFPPAPARPQPIHPGSYVACARGFGPELRALTLECWLRPWDLGRLQGVITQEDKTADDGFALGVGEGGYVGFFLGDGVSPDPVVVHRTAPGLLRRDQWHHLAATWDGAVKRVYVDGVEAGAWPFAGPLRPGAHPLRLGAMGEGGIAQRFLDGDLAAPAVHGRALSAAEVRARFAARGLGPPAAGALAWWPLDEERGERVADASGGGRDGRIINLGTWMIGGPAFAADVPRFGAPEPAADPRRGHGLRLASDDLYDCRWEVTHRWEVPASARPGLYVARFTFTHDGGPRLHDCTFVVRRNPAGPRAPLLLLFATNTWRAYNATPFALPRAGLHQVWGTGGLERDTRGLPAFNLYRDHARGQGTYQMGLRMPWPVAGPHVLYGGPTRYSHLARADRFTHVWLEEQGYACDTASDLDLHRDPGMLRGYAAVLVVGHSEYWSLPMYEGADAYLRGGGNLVVLSGNSVYWRVSFDANGTVMECRKADGPGARVPAARRGEAWHSHDGRRGGLLRECGHPGVNLIALDLLGFNAPAAPEQFGPYVVEDPAHFLFRQPEDLGLRRGDPFGDAGDGVRRANAHEFDVLPSTFARLQREPSPPGGTVPPDPAGVAVLARGRVHWRKGGSAFDYFSRRVQPAEDTGADLVYWERPGGGRVFNAGAIGAGWVLADDPRMAGLLRNVLAHFGVPRPAR